MFSSLIRVAAHSPKKDNNFVFVLVVMVLTVVKQKCQLQFGTNTVVVIFYDGSAKAASQLLLVLSFEEVDFRYLPETVL